jgi:asparagine synthase (glutamine-hydrolysing)
MRWRGTAALKRLFTEELRAQAGGVDSVAALVNNLPEPFASWSPLARDQFVEVTTLLSGYLLSSQGDRMLMANSVEGRFPFLDRNVAALAESLPASYKLRVLDEKHVLKRAARGLVPQEILDRTKQPYRAPDALSFADPAAEAWIEETASEAALASAGVFNPRAARQLIEKCRRRAGAGQFSNADNMAVVGILSTQLVHHQFIASRPEAAAPPAIRTVVDRLAVAAETR